MRTAADTRKSASWSSSIRVYGNTYGTNKPGADLTAQRLQKSLHQVKAPKISVTRNGWLTGMSMRLSTLWSVMNACSSSSSLKVLLKPAPPPDSHALGRGYSPLWSQLTSAAATSAGTALTETQCLGSSLEETHFEINRVCPNGMAGEPALSKLCRLPGQCVEKDAHKSQHYNVHTIWH